MNFMSHDLDKEKLLGFRLLSDNNYKQKQPVDAYLIGARVGAGKGNGQPPPPA